jgi:hypothetical protein
VRLLHARLTCVDGVLGSHSLTGRGLVEMPTKTDSSDRRIPLSPACINALHAHTRHQSAHRDRAADTWTETG